MHIQPLSYNQFALDADITTEFTNKNLIEKVINMKLMNHIDIVFVHSLFYKVY